MREKQNIVFVGKSLDGFIAGPKGELDWLNSIPNPEQQDMGFTALMNEIDAIVMGRTTFDTVCSFEGEWPYTKPVFVLSSSLNEIPKKCQDKAFLLKGDLKQVLSSIHQKGFRVLYIDGGKTVQSFLNENLIDELRISTLPIVLGGGVSLFSILPKPILFDHVKTQVFLNQIVQSTYRKKG